MTEYVYIHIPFCKSKCKYCSFVSYTNIESKEKYLNALKNEINLRYKNEKLKTLYFGGGTPSILSPNQFYDIIKLFNIDENTEITTELNPENISLDYLKELKNIGIKRLSFGCQTFDNNILQLIGRRHKNHDVINSINLSLKAGFENINLDLIYGLPNQSVEMFENDLKIATELDITHISLYGLKIDESSYFGKNPPKNLPNDDCQADMYLKAIEILKKNQFEHYEISNFCKKNYQSKHNINYWNNNEYYGFGVAAHGYENNIRYSNTTDLDKYIKNPDTHKSEHFVTPEEQLEEEIFLGFRKLEGIDTDKINKKFNINFDEIYKNQLKKYSQYIDKTSNGYKLNIDGVLVSNVILADFLH